jgi:hypothetical protein
MLLDWTGRELRADERGAIPAHLARIVERLGNDVVDLKGQNVERLREPAVFAGVFDAVPNQTFQCLVHRVRKGGMDRHYNGSRFLGCGCQANPNPFVAQYFGSPDNAGARQTPRPKCRII